MSRFYFLEVTLILLLLFSIYWLHVLAVFLSSQDVGSNMLCVSTVYDSLQGGIPFVVRVDLLTSGSSAGYGGELDLGNVSSTSCSDSCTGSLWATFSSGMLTHSTYHY